MRCSRRRRIAVATAVVVVAGQASGVRPPPRAFAHEGAYEVRSTQSGGGTLAVTGVPDEPVVVTLTFCDGGECLFENAEASIHTPEEDLPSPALFALPAGTQLALEMVSLDANVSIKAGGTKLDQPRETASLGTAPSLHAEPTLQVTAPSGVFGHWHVAFRFSNPDGAYASSEVIEIELTNEPQLCGDGHLDDHEACDTGGEPWSTGHACSEECEWLGCGDPDGDGHPRASDALFVLAVAVGTHACDHCLCDVDASGGSAPVSSIDALRVLSAAIGIGSASLECPPCP